MPPLAKMIICWLALILIGPSIRAAGCADLRLVPSAKYGWQQNSWSIATADFNGDGAIDLAIPDADYLFARMEIFLGDGRGRFDYLTDYDIPSYTGTLRAGDLDGDGRTDLILRGRERTEIFWGVGDGRFAGPDTPTTLVIPGSVIDLNHDGAADIIGSLGYFLAVQLGGSRILAPPVTVLKGSYDAPRPVVGDVTGDGNPDVIASQTSSMDLLIGNGDGTFRAPLHVDAGGSAPSLADLNGDDAADLILVGYGSSATTSLSQGDGSFAPPVAIDIGLSGDTIRFSHGDFDGDHNIDLVVTSTSQRELIVLRGKGDGTFEAPVPIQLDSPAYGTHVHDLDSNGMPDLVSARYHGGAQAILNGCGVVSGDANGDDILDVADIFYLLNALFAQGPQPPWFADVNADQIITPADIFYLINHLFVDGPAPVQ